MKKITKMTFSLILVTWSLSLTSIVLAAPESTDSASTIDPETIKENIKRRIEQVIKSQATETKKKIAFIGTLSSVTKNSFSLQTFEAVTKQASTSASTVVIQMGTNKEMSLDDISIGDYVAALGFLNDTTQVLDARRILLLEGKPEQSSKKTLFGTTGKIDSKKSTFIIRDGKTSQDVIFKFTTKTLMQVTQDASRKSAITVKDIPENAPILVIFEPAKNEKDDNLVTSLLVHGSTATPSTNVKP